MQKEQRIYKVVTLGEGRVGKTSIITRFVNNSFRDVTEETIQGYCLEKIVKYKGNELLMAIWDTAGQEKYNSMAPLYYRDSDAAIIVFDMTIKETLNKAQKWIKELKQFSANDNLHLVLVGNKCDMTNDIDVDNEVLNQLQKEHNCMYISASAKSSKGIEDIFQYVASQLLSNQDRRKSRNNSLKTHNKKKPQEQQNGSNCNC